MSIMRMRLKGTAPNKTLGRGQSGFKGPMAERQEVDIKTGLYIKAPM
jgi:hypothetical protein